MDTTNISQNTQDTNTINKNFKKEKEEDTTIEEASQEDSS